MKLFDTFWLEPVKALHDLLTEEEREPIEVFAQKTELGWRGWPADWTPQARKESPELEYPSSAWRKVTN